MPRGKAKNGKQCTPQRHITCTNCGREFVGRKDHWACPYCLYAESPTTRNRHYSEKFESQPGNPVRLTADELTLAAEYPDIFEDLLMEDPINAETQD